MKASNVVSITVARLARLQRFKPCTHEQFHEAMARRDVQIVFSGDCSCSVLVKRGSRVVAAMLYGHREAYLIDSAIQQGAIP